MTHPKPHIVFLHGAWHSPVYFAKITSLLQDQLYVVHARQQPAVGVPPSWTPPTDLSQDLEAARSIVDRAIGEGNDVVVICHSWGGKIASSSLVGYSKEEREKKGLKGGVVKVGYMCAMMVDANENIPQREVPTWYELDVRPPDLCPFFKVPLTHNRENTSEPPTPQSSTTGSRKRNRRTGSPSSRRTLSPRCIIPRRARVGGLSRAAISSASRIRLFPRSFRR